jgi:hypothetical protein
MRPLRPHKLETVVHPAFKHDSPPFELMRTNMFNSMPQMVPRAWVAVQSDIVPLPEELKCYGTGRSLQKTLCYINVRDSPLDLLREVRLRGYVSTPASPRSAPFEPHIISSINLLERINDATLRICCIGLQEAE